MSVLLINLRHAPDDEIDEIRQLLDQNHLDYYETKGSIWGISAPGIWLKNKDELKQAKGLLDEYQEQRYQQQHTAYQRLKQSGQQRTFWQNLREQPLQVIFYSLVAILILYFSIEPFFLAS